MIGKNKKYDIIFAGVGGQGVLTASEICSQVAVYEGYFVKRSDIRGLSQRGGAVESQLRIGEGIYSPIIMPKMADLIVTLDSSLTSRIRRKYLSSTGVDLSKSGDNNKLSNIEKRSLNIYMLGILSNYLPFSITSWKKVIKKNITKNVKENIKIFQDGKLNN